MDARAEPSQAQGQAQAHTLAQAKARFRPIRGAIRVAGVNGWTALLLGGLALLLGLVMLDVVGILVGGGVTLAAVHELVQRARLKQLDPTALPRLAINQGIFAGVIVAYCVWSLLHLDNALVTSAIASIQKQFREASAGELDEQTTQTMQSVGELVITVAKFGYAAIALLTLLIEASIAWYYLAKRKHLTAYLKHTPAWVRESQAKGLLG